MDAGFQPFDFVSVDRDALHQYAAVATAILADEGSVLEVDLAGSSLSGRQAHVSQIRGVLHADS